MEARMAPEDKNPKHHTQNMQKRLHEIMDHMRADIKKVDEPQLKAMFETSAEVLGGLAKAFNDYEKKNEPAWALNRAGSAVNRYCFVPLNIRGVRV
jgi:hypothetical protein